MGWSQHVSSGGVSGPILRMMASEPHSWQRSRSPLRSVWSDVVPISSIAVMLMCLADRRLGCKGAGDMPCLGLTSMLGWLSVVGPKRLVCLMILRRVGER